MSEQHHDGPDHRRGAPPVSDRRRRRFSAMLVVVGLAHFVVPSVFVRIVPRWVPRPEAAVWCSGVSEVAAGGLIAVPRTRRLGGWLAAVTIVAVYPANVQMAVDALRSRRPAAIAVTLARLPMQLPMIATALRLTR